MRGGKRKSSHVKKKEKRVHEKKKKKMQMVIWPVMGKACGEAKGNGAN